MRTRTTLLAQFSFMGVLASVLGSCTPAVIDRTLAEQPVFVEVPANGIATPAQKDRYENNPVAVERFEGRCTVKPAAGTACPSYVTLRITVVEGAKHVRVGGHPVNPLLLALIENRGSTATFDGIAPGKHALVAMNKAEPGQPTETAVHLVRFEQMLNSPNFAVTNREYNVLRTCNTHYSGRASDMSFRGCIAKHWAGGNSQSEVMATSLVTLGSQSSFLKRKQEKSEVPLADFVSLDDPLWLRCSPGCCTS